MGAFQDLTGQRFGRLVVNKYLGKSFWECQCDCGNLTSVFTGHLRTGHTKSCGCINRDSPPRKSHGQHGTKLYNIWKSINKRCYNEQYSRFADWGGRGITVCEEWRNDFQAFYDYVSKLPHFAEVGYSLDRIDNDGNYEPGNVRWATPKEQANNRRKRSK